MFGSWDPGTPSRSGSSSGSSTSSTSNEGGAPGHQPAPRSQFLRALYGRAAAARRGLLGRGSSPASESVASSNSASEATALAAAGHSMLGGLRRAEPQATVELARPAPEVEFSRGAHIVRPMLRSTAPADSSSLLSLRASQHSGEFVGSPLSHMSMRDRAASSLASVRPGTRAASSQGGRASGHAAAPLSLACFGDEQDAPFRLNAVEIAAQDDKQECAFLPQERHGLGAEIERGRSILPMMIGQIQPTTAVGSEPASVSSGGPAQPPASGKLRAEREAIALLSRRAQQRLDGGGSGLAGILPQMALRHVQEIVRQLLDEIEVPADSGWDQVILDLVANAVGRVQPNVRGGDKMDLRHYVRIKRIPGGVPADSQYVTGIVFTKNLAHRQMPRFIAAPRIMLLTLPLEYTRQPSRYVSLDDELRMQQGFVEKLVQRIAGAAPDVVMVDKPVPGQVLEGLMRHRIAVIQSVKRGVIRAVARCTGAEIVTSIDRFSSYPRAGSCAALAVQTFEHQSLPEFRKSFVLLDGCNESLGGTIVLRGESFDKLDDIKQVVDLVVGLAYSVCLESALLVDEFALAVPGRYDPVRGGDVTSDDSLALLALSEYDLVLSSSPSVRIPPPHVLVCMREKELAVRAITEKFSQMTTGRRDGPAGSNALASSTGMLFVVSRHQGAASANRMKQQYESELALHGSYIHEGRVFLHNNPDAVSLWDYQGLVVAYMLTCRKSGYRLCTAPQYHQIAFYTGTDITLGQYLNTSFNLDHDCNGESSRCPHPMYEHCHSYIHGSGRVDVTMGEYPCPIERLSEIILMWAECTVCGCHTPVTRMSDETWRYSFGKYLETTFYSAPLRPRAAICSHDLHRDFVRCFTLHNMAVRFTYVEHQSWDIAPPTMPLYFNMEVSIRIKDEEAAELRQKLDAYYASLASSLDEFPLDLVYADKVAECRSLLQSLAAGAATEQVYFQQTLVQTLRNTHPADTLVVVVVYEALQGKVVEWNLKFSELVRLYIQVDRSGRGGAGGPTRRAGDAARLTYAPGHELDSLEIIDELHSAASHHYPPADAGAHAATRFEMPRLSPSPSASVADLAELGTRAGDALGERSRLHRRLSMEMMRFECARLGCRTEKQSRAAEHADDSELKPVPKTKGGHGSADSNTHARQQQQEQHLGGAEPPVDVEPPVDAEQRASGRAARLTWHANPSGFSTSRLVGPVAAEAGGTVRASPKTQFPELRAPRGKSRARLSGLVSKGTQPLLDMLHRTPAPTDPAKSGPAPPTRIPGIRPPKQQQQPREDDDWEMVRHGPLAAASDRRGPATSRPANSGRSNIPLPPRASSRAASPTGDEQGRGSSNVFLRLAKRLNGTRGQHGDGAALGTTPRKMDLLLPAAQLMSHQSSRRQPTPQAQVFYTRPAAGESASRKATPPRRHSYQVVAPEHPDDLEPPQRGRAPRLPRTARQRPAAGGDDDDDDVLETDDYQSPRHRSATVSQVQRPAFSAGGPGRSLTPSQRQISATHAKPPVAPDGDSGERTQSVSLRPSSLIPSLTRRLGLGFGSRPDPPPSSGTSSKGGSVDAADRPVRRAGSRVVSSSSTKGSLHERGPVPPRLSIDSATGSAGRSVSRRASRRMSRWTAGRGPDLWDGDDHDHSPRSAAAVAAAAAAAARPLSSYSMQISIDSSSDSDDDLDVDDSAVYAHSSLRTPSAADPKSYRSSYRLDGPSSEPDSADSSHGPIGHLLSSPVRPLPLSGRGSQQLLLSAADGRDGMPRTGLRGMLSSLHRQHSYGHWESSAEDDELDTHKPDLHFGQSDTGSDAELMGPDGELAAGSAASPPGVAAAADMAVADASGDALVRGASATTAGGGGDLPPAGAGPAESGNDASDSTALVPSPPEYARLWKTISNLLTSDSSQLFQIGLNLAYPLGPTEHVVPGSPIIVRESEPSSIIAYTLLNDEYRKTLQTLFEDARKGDVGGSDARRRAREADDGSSGGSGGSHDDDLDEQSPLNEFSRAHPPRDEHEDVRRVLLNAHEHVCFEFTAGQKQFVCDVYYAAQFETLRRCNGCEDSYIESLSRCMPYDAKGGKSGSAFLLTQDRRFIVKQVSKPEASAFLKFAPSYFEHMYLSWLHRDDLPSVLAKILGFCRVSRPNPAGGKPLKMSVMIMENLFYGRSCRPVYDLKGSERNRMVDDTGSNVVLQDENLIKTIRDRPICIRQPTKTHLRAAIWNDTLFLSRMNVMDYSLLVGFDERNNQLVVGIIDFIRTFTWDKKLESWVKEAGILGGGGGKGPTIVSPKQYKNRFREAMDRYFLMVPDMFDE